MDFSLSEEQRLLQASVGQFVRRHADPASSADPRVLVSAMADLGWLAIAAPEDQGGLGGSAVDIMVVMEALGRGLLAAPFVTPGVVTPTILAACEATKPLLADAILGGNRVSLACFEHQGRFRLDRIETRATRAVGGWILDGAKTFVEAPGEAAYFLVSARTQGGVALLLVPKNTPGLQMERFQTLDGGEVADLVLGEICVPFAAMVAGPAAGAQLLETIADRVIAALCAEAVGAMDALFEMTVDYLRGRQQFGKPLAGFQVLQHRAADLYAACEDARSLMLLATLKLDAPPRERVRAVSAAKSRIGQLARFVANQAIQLHGAMGMCDEVAVGRYAKRLMTFDTVFGNADFHRARFADA